MSARLLSGILMLLLAGAASADEAADPARSFSTLRVQIETQLELSGWQMQLDFGASDARIVGIEGGDAPAFSSPPHYDPQALNGGEIILAALAAGPRFPTGRTTVAVLHVEHRSGELPRLQVTRLIAVGADGNEIGATVIHANGAER